MHLPVFIALNRIYGSIYLMDTPKKQKFKILDLFCKAGGASYGMFWVDPGNIEITGVDLEYQKNYPFNFIQSDFREVDLSGYNFIWASPPCQRFSRMTPKDKKENHPDYIPELRTLLKNNFDRSGIHYCIENVPCSPLNVSLKLTGEMFNQSWNKERWFEMSFFILQPGSGRRRYNPKAFIHTSNKSDRGILSYMTHDEYKNAVPVQYSNFILKSFLDQQTSLNRAYKVKQKKLFSPAEGY